MEENLKRMKIAVTLVAAALLTMAAVGTGTASAINTVLCSEPGESICSQSSIQPIGSTLDTFNDVPSSVEWFSLKIINPSGEEKIKCRDNQITLKSLAQKYDPLPAEFQGSVDPTECRTMSLSADHACTEASLTSGTTNIYTTGKGNGIAKTSGLKLSFKCKRKIMGISITETCSYAASGPVEIDIRPGLGQAVIYTSLTQTTGVAFCGEETVTLHVDNEMNPNKNHISGAL